MIITLTPNTTDHNEIAKMLRTLADKVEMEYIPDLVIGNAYMEDECAMEIEIEY